MDKSNQVACMTFNTLRYGFHTFYTKKNLTEMQSFFLSQAPPPHFVNGSTDRKAVQVHGELPEIAAHPGPVMGSDGSSVRGHSASHLHADKQGLTW